MKDFDAPPRAFAFNNDQRDAALHTISERINAWSVSEEIKSEIKKRAADLLESHAVEDSIGFRGRPQNLYTGGQIGNINWIIKNDDLKLLEQLIPAALAIITFLSVPTAPFAVMAGGLAFSMIGIGNKFRTKSMLLDPAEYHVLMVLKQCGSCAPSKVAEVLSGLHIYGKDVWDDQRVLAVIEKLKEYPARDGTATKIVNQSSAGLWSTAGI